MKTDSYKLFGSKKLEETDLKALDAFSVLYNSFFKGDEKEEFGDILARIGNTEASICTYAYLLYEGDNLVGGMVADWYHKCSTLEIIYLVIERAFQGNGNQDKNNQDKKYGDMLLDCGLKAICDAIGTGKVKYVFFESKNPFYNGNIESKDEYLIRRLRFFARHGAKRIPIHYVQPPLSPNRDFARDMCLFCLPAFSERIKEDNGLVPEGLKAFLEAFYNELAAQSPKREKERQTELENMMKEVDVIVDNDDKVPLDSLIEECKYCIKNVSVATHFLYLNDSQFTFSPEIEISKNEGDDACPVFYSYQTDLMDYSHQGDNMPFSTYHYNLYENVHLRLPSAYYFESEGQSHIKLPVSEPCVLNVDISLNWSKSSVPELGYQVHMVICPTKKDNSSYFSELDLIRLITAFGSRQERYRYIDCNNVIKDTPWEGFYVIESDNVLLVDWIADKMKLVSDMLKATRSGVTEIDVSGLFLTEDRKSLFSDYEYFRTHLQEKNLWNKTLCGIILGIFDFERMNTAEIYDTIRPVVIRPQSFMVFCRGHMIKIKGVVPGEDYERVENILISPYLLIPSCALAYNERLLSYCQNELIKLMDDEMVFQRSIYWLDRKYYERSRILLNKYDEVKTLLADHYLQGFFQYESERQILSEMNLQRGFTKRLEMLEKQLDTVKTYSDKHIQDYHSGVESWQNAVLLILALLQVVVAVFAIENDCEKLALSAMSAALIIGGLLIGRISLMRDRKER